MKILMQLALFYFLCISSLNAASQQNLTVPFENITLLPNQLISANFNFGNFSVIFCFENTTTQNIGRITWPFKGQIFQSSLPIFLITNPIFSGSFADHAGVLTIQNTTGTFIVVSCLFAY